MKYIFDFDDVIFHTTKHRKEHMFKLIEEAGVSQKQIEKYYKIAREKCFSLTHMLENFSINKNLYEEIMSESKNFINKDIFEFIRKIGKNNCYIVTYGDAEFNKDKIVHSGAFDLFNPENVFIVQGSKNDILEKICAQYKNEEVYFIDDKQKHFDELDMKNCPNLKTILYTGQDLSSFLC